MGILDFVKRGIFLPKSSTCLFCGGEIKNGQCTKCRQVCEICKKGLSREDITISCFECHSTYHVNELDDWYQTGKPCPVCRENLREEFQNYEARGTEQWSSKYQLLFTIQDYAKVNPVYTRHFLVGFFVLLTTAIFDLNLGWFPLEWPQLLLFSLTVIIYL